MARPVVTVIIPCYNAERTIARCIESLLKQDLGADRIEILLVDNNSTDGTARIAQRFPRVRLLREPKQGAYAARNRALAEAAGDVVAFTDPDCLPETDWLTMLTEPFRDPGVQVVKGRTRPASRSRWLDLLYEYEHHRDLHVFAGSDPTLYYGQANNLAARRGALEMEGGFTELARGADVIFVRRVVDRYGCGAVCYRSGARVLHLEVDGLIAHFRKVSVYRLSRSHFGPIANVRVPTVAERLRILARAVRAGDIGRARSLPVAVLLAAAVTYGRIAGFGRFDASGRVIRRAWAGRRSGAAARTAGPATAREPGGRPGGRDPGSGELGGGSRPDDSRVPEPAGKRGSAP